MIPTVAKLGAQVKIHLGELAQAVDGTARDEAFTGALRDMARFWRYSVLNQALIRIQRADASRVTSRLAWEAMGRTVKPGEVPLLVRAPSRFRGGGARFVPVEVFDIRQTRGRRPRELDLSLRGRSGHWRLLEQAARGLGVEVAYLRLPRGLRGLSRGGRIEVARGLPGQESTAVLAHELAHEVLHQAERGRRKALKRPGAPRTRAEEETEADATAWVVLRVLGLPSKAPAYIAWQGGTGLAVLRSLTRVQRAVRRILEAAELPAG